MYRNMLRVQDEYLAKTQALPRNTTATGNGGARRAGSQMGAFEVVVVATAATTIADGKSLTLALEDSADGTAFAPLAVSFKRTVSGGARTWKPGDVLGRVPLPSDCRSWVRAVMGTDDASAAGTVDIVFDYMPR